MIHVFAGQENSPVMPGVHHLIGSCETVTEAHEGFEMWCSTQRAEWLATLSKCHSEAEAQALAKQAKFWHQFVQHTPGADPEFTILQEDGKAGVLSAPNAEMHYAREALLAFDRADQQGEDGDPGQATVEHDTAMEFVEKWRVEFAKTRTQ